jgi:two-component system chemotaxis sensor kinase CheA
MDHHELMRMVRAWRHPSVATVLGPYVATAKKTAARLDKEVDVVLDDKGLRLPHSDLRSFCATLVHVLRNALDHGIEAPEERLRAGKAAAGRITIAARAEASSFVLAISDDGRGIDWTRLRAKAEAAGLAAETERDLVDALFADGVSTRDDVTTLSGRGVGLGATKTRCEDLGGVLSVKTVPGSGTTFEFSFPVRSSLAPAA